MKLQLIGFVSVLLFTQVVSAQHVRNLTVQVTDIEGNSIGTAKVSAGKQNASYDKAAKVYKLDNYKGDTLKLTVNAKGYLPAAQTVNLNTYSFNLAKEPVNIVLAQKGDLMYWAGKEQVPYKSTPGLMGIIPNEKAYKNQPENDTLRNLIKSLNLEIVSYDKMHKANSLPQASKTYTEQVIVLQKKDKSPFDRKNSKELAELRKSGLVSCAGPLLNSHTILTNRVTTQFSDNYALKKDSVFTRNQVKPVQSYGDGYDIIEMPGGMGEEVISFMDGLAAKHIVNAIYPDICQPVGTE